MDKQEAAECWWCHFQHVTNKAYAMAGMSVSLLPEYYKQLMKREGCVGELIYDE
jgi:hypothetical protein